MSNSKKITDQFADGVLRGLGTSSSQLRNEGVGGVVGRKMAYKVRSQATSYVRRAYNKLPKAIRIGITVIGAILVALGVIVWFISNKSTDTVDLLGLMF